MKLESYLANLLNKKQNKEKKKPKIYEPGKGKAEINATTHIDVWPLSSFPSGKTLAPPNAT